MPVLAPTHDQRVHLQPGEYLAYCRATSTYKDKQFKRWICLLQFDVRTDDLQAVIGEATRFFNLGNREQPHAGRRGDYWRAWCQANGGPPKRQDRLSSRVFEKRLARVVLRDVVKDFRDHKNEIDPAFFYSVVADITRWEGIANSGPKNQLTIQPT
jgi:hypothetical protein